MEDSVRAHAAVGARSISGMIEGEVLPRLVERHRDPPAGGARRTTRHSLEPIEARDLELVEGYAHPEIVWTLAEFVVDHDLSRAGELLTARRADGVPADELCVDYLAPTARLLGDLWSADRLDFSAVTMGTGRLQQLQRSLADDLEGAAPVVPERRCALLAPAPGEQHTFGVNMIASFMRRDGWDVIGGPGLDERALLAHARSGRFDLVGFGIGSERWVEDLQGTVARLRDVSRNPDFGLMIGGSLCATVGGLEDYLGADALVTDAMRVAETARALLARND